MLLVTAAVPDTWFSGTTTRRTPARTAPSTSTRTDTATVNAGAERDAGVYRSVLQGDAIERLAAAPRPRLAGSTITSVAPEDGTLGTQHPIPLSLIGMGIGPTSLWMLGMKTETSINSVLAEVDPDTGDTIREIPLPGLPACLKPPVGRCNPVVGAGSVWAPMGGRSSASR